MHDKAFNTAQDPKCDGCQGGLASVVYKFFDKKTSGSGIKNENDKKTSGSGIKNENMLDQLLAEELHKPNIEKTQEMKSTITFYRQYLGS